jgi:hypothetical protein
MDTNMATNITGDMLRLAHEDNDFLRGRLELAESMLRDRDARIRELESHLLDARQGPYAMPWQTSATLVNKLIINEGDRLKLEQALQKKKKSPPTPAPISYGLVRRMAHEF